QRNSHTQDVERLPNVEPFGDGESHIVVNNSEELCAICLQQLSRKLVSTIAACGHKYHWSCLYKWYDTQKQMLVRATCCTCRGRVKLVTDEDGQRIRLNFPIELNILDAKLREGISVADSFMRSNRVSCAENPSLSLRDGKSAEYVADIEEEIEKLRIRTIALHAYFFKLLEFKELQGNSELRIFGSNWALCRCDYRTRRNSNCAFRYHCFGYRE
ncbi:hypothetical protein PRIPAC_94144, partial [Pristionchus pacificus]|uniref:RING-type domain-containing protein n=1 Tax=Pristionchus pacificus TaxID=54126 RepID=A0A2A6CDZ0_PRIPA